LLLRRMSASPRAVSHSKKHPTCSHSVAVRLESGEQEWRRTCSGNTQRTFGEPHFMYFRLFSGWSEKYTVLAERIPHTHTQ
jgi:hypothetical protein